jgi:hypothetical protein
MLSFDRLDETRDRHRISVSKVVNLLPCTPPSIRRRAQRLADT